MLNLKGITKIYKIDKIEQKVLNKVSINFMKNEFVSILGPSGSGKSTLLNIIGGLDHYTHGDLIIKVQRSLRIRIGMHIEITALDLYFNHIIL